MRAFVQILLALQYVHSRVRTKKIIFTPAFVESSLDHAGAATSAQQCASLPGRALSVGCCPGLRAVRRRGSPNPADDCGTAAVFRDIFRDPVPWPRPPSRSCAEGSRNQISSKE